MTEKLDIERAKVTEERLEELAIEGSRKGAVIFGCHQRF